MYSAYEHPDVVDAYLTRKAHLQRIIPLDDPTLLALPRLMISPFGVIPKHHQPNKRRLIVDLSAPEGHSINDAINASHCSIKYALVDDAAEIICHLGTGTLMAKFNLRDAYRVIPVHPLDRPLLTREAYLQRIILLDDPTFLALVGSFYLIYRPDEDPVTFVPSSSVLEQLPNVGDWCGVKYSRKVYKGKIAKGK